MEDMMPDQIKKIVDLGDAGTLTITAISKEHSDIRYAAPETIQYEVLFAITEEEKNIQIIFENDGCPSLLKKALSTEDFDEKSELLHEVAAAFKKFGDSQEISRIAQKIEDCAEQLVAPRRPGL